MDRATLGADEAIRLIGKYFPPDREVTIALGNTDRVLGKTRTDAIGSFDLDIEVPNTVPYGVSYLKVDATGAPHLIARFKKVAPDEASPPVENQ